jgi:chromosome segregation ATPase
MADKPKTYPQKVAELQAELQLKDDRINELLQANASVEEMQGEIAHLREQLAIRSQQDQTGSVNNKSQMVDLEQRAVSAEKQLRDLRQQNLADKGLITALHEQLDLAGADRDKNLGKEQKIQLLDEQLKDANLRIASFNQQMGDLRRQATEQIANLEKVNLSMQRELEGYRKQLNNVVGVLYDAPDVIGQLKSILRLS